MNKRTREKIALVVFLVLGFGVAAVLLGYFSTGRTWNVAASVVDDTMGRMEGYTALVYDGTTDAAEGGKALAGASSSGSSLAAAVDDPTVADSLGLAILSILPPLPSAIDEGVHVSDVRDLYERKEAQVVSIDTLHPERYARPVVLASGDQRVGVAWVDSYTTEARLAEMVEGLLAEGANLVVCLTPRPAYLATASPFDVVIVTTAADGTSLRGADEDGAFVVQAPPLGDVGLVVLTQNNVPSAKVVEVL